MAKQLNVSLAFTADTSQAKTQLQDLQNQLNKITTGTKIGAGIKEDIQGAIKAASELGVHLKKATNLETGNLDFAKFNRSLQQSGMSLQQYGASLQKLGPQGQQAFMSLAQSVATSEIPIRRSNALLKEFGTTLANTARWQLSSSMLHGFMSAVQSAYGYAQDLNESLNNIRIVTGQNIDQMAKFAQEANKAARALSATTTNYTNASLIYYQQGLNDQQVKERTDITIKMANVARESAEVISDQMTAVWNNFYDGSKSLEHYADVMTALGAATASSTDEITGGLEKFAAIGNTIGLSFEYAASALATITSNTRQSEEVVGTALKTIFARIQGLKLGESLEDGTNLNKYSEALQTVGISIYDSSGELKKMDNILNEMAAKWDNLSKAQQAALAQTVAGVRQYTQLIALMENWDNGDSDSMMANLTTSATSAGALQEQADIYAESWEAAQDRVTAALEAIYSSLIKDESFIGLLNGVEKVINFVGELVDRLGGLKGTLLMIGTIVTKVFHSQLSQGLTNMAYNIKMMTEAGRKSVVNDRNQFINDAVSMIPKNSANATDLEKAQQESMRSQLTLQQELTENASKMNQYELEVNKSLLDRNRILQEQVVLATKNRDAAQQKVKDSQFALQSRIMSGVGKDKFGERDAKLTTEITTIQQTSKAMANINGLFDQFSSKTKKSQGDVKALQQAILNLDTGNPEIQNCISYMKDYSLTTDNAEKEVKELLAQILAIQTASRKKIEGFIPMKKGEASQVRSEINGLVNSINAETEAERTREQAVKEGAKAHDMAATSIRNYKGVQKSWSDIIVEGASLAMNAAMAFQMLGSTIDTLKDPDTSGWEKFTTILMTLGMLIPTLISAWGSLKSLISAETVVKIANALATLGQAAAERKLNKEKGEGYKVTKENIKNTIKDTKNKVKNGAKDRVQSFKDNWNKAAFEKQGGTLHKNGTSSLKGRQGVIGKEETSKLLSNAGQGAARGLGTSALSIAAIAAGIAVIAGGIVWGVKQAHKAEEAIEKAKDRVKELEANLEIVKSSYSDFQSKVSAFESAEKGIEGLTKGTKEYSQAVYEANQVAMSLIETNKDLKYSVKDGVITFDEGELDRALKKQQDAFTKSQAAKILGNQAIIQAEQNKSVRDYSRTIDSKSDNGQNIGNVLGALGTGAGGGALIGAGLGSLLGGGIVSWLTGPIGAAIGAVVGGIGGLVTGLVGISETGAAVTAEAQALEKLAAAYQLDSSILAKKTDGEEGSLQDYLSKSIEEGGLGIDDEKLVNALSDDVEATRALMDEIVRNTAAINAQNDQIAASALGDEAFIQQSEFGDAIIDKAGDAYGNMVNNILNSEAMQQWGANGISKASGANDKAEDIFQQYLEAAGLDNQGYKLKSTKGTDKNREFVYLDADGNKKTVSLNTMQYTMASAQALGRLEQIATEMAVDLHKWAEDKDPTSQAMLSFLSTGNFGDATKGEFDAINSAVISTGGIEEYLKSIFGEDLESTAEKYGYDGAESFINAFEVAISNGAKDWNNIKIPGISDELKENLNLSDAKKFEVTVDFINTNTAEDAGEKAGENFLKGLNDFMVGVDPADQEKAWTKIAQIDWTQFDAGYEIIDIFEDMGYTMTEEALPAFEQWVSETNTATLAVFDFGAAMKEIAAVKDIVKDIDLGSIISQEDYNLLVKYNKELAKYFSVLATGEARFIGDKLDFQQAVEQEEKNTYKKAITDTKTSYGNIIARKDRQDIADEKYGGYALLSTQAGSVQQETQVINEEAKWYEKAGAGTLAYMGGIGAETYYDFWGSYDAILGLMTETEKTVDVFKRNADQYENQIAFLNEMGADLSGINTDSATYSEEDAKAVVEKISQYAEQNVSKEELDQAIAAMNQSQLEYARTAENPEEREVMVEEGLISEQIAATAAMETHQTEKWEDMDPDKVEEYADSLMDAAESSNVLSEELKTNEEAAEDVALYTQKMNRGINKLADGFDDWSDVLNNSSKESDEYNVAMSDMKEAMSDVLGVSEDFLSDDFIIKNLKDIELAAQGDAEAIDRLAIAAAQDILIHMEFESDSTKAEVLALHEELAGMIPDIKVGTELEGTDDFLVKAQEIVAAAGMSAEQANAYFRSMGFETKFATVPQSIEQRVPITHTKTSIVDKGIDQETGAPWWETATTSWQDGYDTYTGDIDAIAMSTDGKTPVIESITRTNSGAMNNYSSLNPGGKSPGGGGGGSSKKSVDSVKKSDVVDRYKEIEDQLDNVRDATDRASKAADRLYGKDRINAMKEVNKNLKQEVELLKTKKGQAETYLKEDKATVDSSLAAAAKELGFNSETFKFNYDQDTGDITNYESIMTQLWKEQQSVIDAANADGKISESEQTKIDQIQDAIDNLTGAIDQYDDTKEISEGLDTEIEDLLYQIQDNNFEMFNYKLEIKLSLNQDDIDFLDYKIDKLGDNIYTVAEAAAYLFGKVDETSGKLDFTGSKYSEALDMWDTLQQSRTDLETQYKNGEISQADFIAGLDSLKEQGYNVIQMITQMDDAMMNYYGDTLNMAMEEIDKYTDQMEHLNGVLDHYSNILSIMGKEQDYEAMGVLLDGQAKTAQNTMEAAKAVFDFAKAEKDAAYERWQTALNDPKVSDETVELYENEYRAALDAANQAEEEFLASAEQALEAWRALIENNLKKMGKELEKALTGGKSFDWMSTTMERMNSLQDEYLTTTNKIYETNKLMNKAQQEIDKTSNTVAKKKLKEFNEQTKSLQDQTALSKFELDIQQAKYDLLLAEIALEEAQNAKSQVRLQRDSEGNFGYVYTADSSAVDDAQQKYEDAQNNLYNISLEGANKYAEERTQLLSEMYSTFEELNQQYLDGAFASEKEYQDAVTEAKTYYYEKLRQNSELYNIAISADASAAAEHILGEENLIYNNSFTTFSSIATDWKDSMTDMIGDASEWQNAVDTYFTNAGNSLEAWNKKCTEIAEASGLNDLSGAVKAITTESENLLKTLVGDGDNEGLIKGLQDQLDKVKEITEAYGKQRAEILGTITEIENYIQALNLLKQQESGLDGEDPADPDKPEDPDDGKGGEDPDAQARALATQAKEIITKVHNGTIKNPKSTGWKPYAKEAGYSDDAINLALNAFNDSKEGAGYSYYYKKALELVDSYDTGGYTGDWEGPGKMAILHQKELVLNEKDTDNFLHGMEMMQHILSTLEVQAAYAEAQVNQYTTAYAAAQQNLAAAASETSSGVIEQSVKIEASFPGVTNRNEIEEAFDNLVNLASQYANRK